jgi:UDP-3-O-[3-hydroxymyristoyl] glucosamine N-acyltransferase
MKLGEIAHRIHAELTGDPNAEITGIAPIEHAAPGQLAFVTDPRYAAAAHTTRASAVIVAKEFPAITAAALRTANPHLAYAKAVEIFYPPHHFPLGIHPTAIIANDAKIGPRTHIGAYAVIMHKVEIGEGAVILPHVVIYDGARIGKNFIAHAHAVVREHCVLGDNVILQNGAVIGSDGFGFAKDSDGRWQKITQSAPVIIGNHVEVQANSCIDRPSIGQTRIADGVKIDNLVQVAHGCDIGENSLLCAQVGLAGSTTLGRGVILAGQVGVAGHCELGDGVVATAQSGLHGDIPAGKVMSGYPAVESRQWLRIQAALNKLPELVKRLRTDSRSAPGPEKEPPK